MDEYTRLTSLNAIVRGWAEYYGTPVSCKTLRASRGSHGSATSTWLLAKHKGSHKSQLIREKTRRLHGRTRWHAEVHESGTMLEVYQWLPTPTELARQRYRQKGIAGFPHPYLSGNAEATGDHPQGATGPDERIYTTTVGIGGSKRDEPLEIAERKLRAKVRDGMKCRQCGTRTDLAVHHIKGLKSHALRNLVTLCRTCHLATHRLSQLQTV